MLNYNLHFHFKNQGGATLVVSLVILMMMTIVTFYTANTVLMEQKVTTNDYRGKQGFEAAEAGMGDALYFLSNNSRGQLSDFLTVDGNSDGDTLDVGINDEPNPGDVYDEYHLSLTNGTRAIVQLDDQANIQSQGFSDDNSSERTIRQFTKNVNPLPNDPQNPLTVKGPIKIGGSVTVYNHEGHTTIWGGNEINLSSNNSSATYVSDPATPDRAAQNDAHYAAFNDPTDPNSHPLNHPAYPACMDFSMACLATRSSNQVSIGLDAIEYDSSLANLSIIELFKNYFGRTPQNYYDNLVTLKVAAANAGDSVTDTPEGLDLQAGEIAWVGPDPSVSLGTGAIAINGITFGCSVSKPGLHAETAANGRYPHLTCKEPGILIVNGDLQLSGQPVFYGFVFVLGNVTGSGSTSVEGAIVIAGDIPNAMGGSINIWYNSDLLGMLTDLGVHGGYAGSWNDHNF